MALFEPVLPDNASGELRGLYDELCRHLDMSRPPNWAVHLGTRPDLLRAFNGMIEKLTSSRLSALMTQLLLFSVAFTNRAEYCLQYHGYKILRLVEHLTYDDLLGICLGESRAVIPERDFATVQMAIELCTEKCALDAGDLERFAAMGYGAEDVQDIVFCISFGWLFNTYTMIAGIPIEPEYRIPGFRLPDDCPV